MHVPVYKRMFILNIDVLVLFRFCGKKININRERKGPKMLGKQR